VPRGIGSPTVLIPIILLPREFDFMEWLLYHYS
jgi:hypothetical protein